jgi:hypothetical protein
MIDLKKRCMEDVKKNVHVTFITDCTPITQTQRGMISLTKEK